MTIFMTPLKSTETAVNSGHCNKPWHSHIAGFSVFPDCWGLKQANLTNKKRFGVLALPSGGDKQKL